MYVHQTHGSRTERGDERLRLRVPPGTCGRSPREWGCPGQQCGRRRADPSCCCGGTSPQTQPAFASQGGNASQQRSQTSAACDDEQGRTCSARRGQSAHDRSGRSGMSMSHGHQAQDSRSPRASTGGCDRSVPRDRSRLSTRAAAPSKNFRRRRASHRARAAQTDVSAFEAWARVHSYMEVVGR